MLNYDSLQLQHIGIIANADDEINEEYLVDVRPKRQLLAQVPQAKYSCLFALLLYIPSQPLWSWRDGQFT